MVTMETTMIRLNIKSLDRDLLFPILNPFLLLVIFGMRSIILSVKKPPLNELKGHTTIFSYVAECRKVKNLCFRNNKRMEEILTHNIFC